MARNAPMAGSLRDASNPDPFLRLDCALAETDRNLRFKRTCERRAASVSRETASEGPSPAQLTELRLRYTMTRSRGFCPFPLSGMSEAST